MFFILKIVKSFSIKIICNICLVRLLIHWDEKQMPVKYVLQLFLGYNLFSENFVFIDIVLLFLRTFLTFIILIFWFKNKMKINNTFIVRPFKIMSLSRVLYLWSTDELQPLLCAYFIHLVVACLICTKKQQLLIFLSKEMDFFLFSLFIFYCLETYTFSFSIYYSW